LSVTISLFCPVLGAGVDTENFKAMDSMNVCRYSLSFHCNQQLPKASAGRREHINPKIHYTMLPIIPHAYPLIE
jgi:hypothetical protein